MTRIVICGGPKTGKTTLAEHLYQHDPVQRVCTPFHTDDLIPRFEHLGREAWSAASQHVADEWLTLPGPWIIEGVAAVRALRKWRDQHPGAAPPVDRVIRLTAPHVELTPGQAAMAKGEETVWQEIAGWLYLAGVPRAEQVEIVCEHPGYNGIAKLDGGQ